ncbi:MAG: ribose ABC transporter permease, partial [Gemmatimonas sp.]
MHRRELGTAIGLILLALVLWVATPHFLTGANLLNVIEQSAIIGVIAVGMTFVILTGGIDLSVGSLVALTGVVFGLAAQAGAPMLLAAFLAIVVGATCGSINGALVTLGRLP